MTLFFLRRILLMVALAAPVTTLSLEPEKLFEKVAPSVVIVWSLDANARKEAQGSGIVIAPREVITNCHVIDKALFILIEQGGRSAQARTRFTDLERDLCQLTMDAQQQIGVPISGAISYKELKVGQRVYTVGAPEGLELSLGEGIISQLRGTDSFDLIQTTAPVSHGSSGGGLFDADGRLIGITTFIFKEGQNLNFAIPASWIFELSSRFTDRQELTKKKATAKAKAEQDELARRKAEDDERNRREADRRRREDTDRLTEQRRYRENADSLERLARSEIDSYEPSVSPRVRTHYYDVHASNAEQLYREIFLNRGPLTENGKRHAAATRWEIQWNFRTQKVSGSCVMKEVTVAIAVVHTFPYWFDVWRAPAEYAARWQSFMSALRTFQALHQKIGNMAADEIKSKTRSMPLSSSCESLERDANNIAQEVIGKYQEQDDELNRSTNYGDTLGARFPR